MEEKLYDMIVIGGGAAGYTAALYGARSGLSVLVLEKFAPGGQMTGTDRIDNYPGFPEGISGYELGENIQKCALRFGAENEFAEVKEAELTGTIKKVKTRRKEYQARTVVIATGAYPRKTGTRERKSWQDAESLIARPVTECSIRIRRWQSAAAETARSKMRCTFRGSAERFILFTEETLSARLRYIRMRWREAA